MENKDCILNGQAVLGIELGSTRIKAVLTDEHNEPIASGSYEWENHYENGIWTYPLEEALAGLQGCYQDLAKEVKERYDVTITSLKALGISGMMHGYLPFDTEGNLLTPFRTWRNTITAAASGKLTESFAFHIPQRWSIAHFYQAMLNGEDHIDQVDYLTTLAGYVHWKLTGRKVMGIGEASGMFPIDADKKNWNQTMLEQFDALARELGHELKVESLLPKVLVAGENAGYLTEEGARLLDPTGNLRSGVPMCPPEGDAGTGMVATNSVKVRTGNVSAGTSVFGMIVLEKDLQKVHEEIDIATTPDGKNVAMVHCNNCTSDLNAWVNLFKEFAENFGITVDMNQIYGMLYNKALEGDADCGKLLAYNYLSGEHITGLEEGRPLFVRMPDGRFNLANFMKTHLFASLGVLKVGMNILLEEEGVKLEEIYGHGGLFKTKGVGQAVLAAALHTPVSVLETAGEGGAWGIAVLAAYMAAGDAGEDLGTYLERCVFAGKTGQRMEPDEGLVADFEAFTERYLSGLAIERAAVDAMREKIQRN